MIDRNEIIIFISVRQRIGPDPARERNNRQAGRDARDPRRLLNSSWPEAAATPYKSLKNKIPANHDDFTEKK
jgi:hypothetical protein